MPATRALQAARPSGWLRRGRPPSTWPGRCSACCARLLPLPLAQRAAAAWREADAIADEDVAINQAIGRHGLQLLRELARAPRRAG